MPSTRFDEQASLQVIDQATWRLWNSGSYSFQFENFFHPFVGKLIQQLNAATGDPIAALCDPAFLAQTEDFFTSEYQSLSSNVTLSASPKAIDLEQDLPYANYNWELLFHLPVAVAVHLSQNQRFAEAEKWFHYVFDPTSTDPEALGPARFWKFLGFRQEGKPPDVGQLIEELSSTVSDPAGVQSLLASLAASINTPFSPFAVARTRPASFQYYVVMAYLDNLIAWGDSLFSQMTIETVNEATLCYVLAANLLGPRPEQVPALGVKQPKSYNELRAAGLDALGDALVELEGQFPLNIVAPTGGGGDSSPLFGIGRTLYFCVPANTKLLGYWDTVEDRLIKIRNCENIHGQIQLMPLFDPPLDPGMLVKAATAGLDLAQVVSGLNQPTSPLRTVWLIQKALELANEVRGLGSNLLAALEKQDAEHLASMRQTHEVSLATFMQNVRLVQWNEAKAATEGLLRTRANALERYTYYLRLLDSAPDPTTAPPTFAVDHETPVAPFDSPITEDTFDNAYQELVGQYDLPMTTIAYSKLPLAAGNSPATQSGASGIGSLYLTRAEDNELNNQMPTARDEKETAGTLEMVASGQMVLPALFVDLHYWGVGGHGSLFEGLNLASATRAVAEHYRTSAGLAMDQGAMSARAAGYQRRADEWVFQANSAARELQQIGRQLLTSILTEQAAQAEYESAKQSLADSSEVSEFMQTKFTNEQLYGWLQGQLSNLYYQYYRLALDLGRKAEQTMKFELMRPEIDANTYVQSNYWNTGYQGLTSGEALTLDLRRMEGDYHTYNTREIELTRHISLRQLDPLALLELKITGACSLSIPEWLFDRDCPGHYMRRIKTVAVSIPSVVGPYTSVNCTLTLESSSIRVSPVAGARYARKTDGDDTRFVDNFSSTQSIVTSGAMVDSGMFETNLRDERFLPFEGSGAISSWKLALPPIAGFDYSTITDLVLHVRYTARDAGQALAAPATTALEQLPPKVAGDPTPTLALLLDLRHDFPDEWYAFTTDPTKFTMVLSTDRFPYFLHGATFTLAGLTLYSNADGSVETVTPSAIDTAQLASVGNALNAAGSAQVTIAVDADVAAVLRPDAREAYAIVTFSAHR